MSASVFRALEKVWDAHIDSNFELTFLEIVTDRTKTMAYSELADYLKYNIKPSVVFWLLASVI